MTVSIINTNDITTIKFIYTDEEKESITIDSDIDFVHTDNVNIINPMLFKEQICKIINGVEIKKSTTN